MMEQNIIELLKQKNINFTEQQKKAVLHDKGPALVLAVPGSGKTTVIMGHIGHLIKSGQARADNILAITFSKASAIDMTNRFNSLFENEGLGDVRFSTIHAFGNWVVGQYNRQKGIQERLITAQEAYDAIKRSYNQATGEYLTEENIEQYVTAIGFIKNRLLKNKQLQDYCNRSELEALSEVLLGYENFKKIHKLYDYDDMLIKTIKILKTNASTRQFLQTKYKHICVDEVQDTSILQHQLIKLIVNSDSNIFMVGDDCQSIYAFRGADNRIILNINELYPNTKCYLMEENFRSHKNITNLANIAIESNKHRYNKSILSNKIDGDKVNIIYAKDGYSQAQYIIKNLNLQFSSTAILYRNNLSLIPLAIQLKKNNIQFCAKNYKTGFFNHWVITDVLTIINFMLDETNILAFSKIYYKIGVYLNKNIINDIVNTKKIYENTFDFIFDNCQLAEKQKSSIRYVKNTFRKARQLEPHKGIEYLLGFLGYYEYLDKTASNKNISVNMLLQLIDVLKEAAKEVTNYGDIKNLLNSLNKDLFESKKNINSELHLCTLHSSKGLEFDTVYIINVDEGILPSPANKNASKEEKEANDEEEIRLLYVGITRAKKRLSLINTDGKESKFLNSLKKNPDLIKVLKT